MKKTIIVWMYIVLSISMMRETFGITTLSGVNNTNGWDLRKIGKRAVVQGTPSRTNWVGAVALCTNTVVQSQHAGGNIGEQIIFDGVAYTILAKTNIFTPATGEGYDLTVFRVAGSIPTNLLCKKIFTGDPFGKRIRAAGFGGEKSDPIFSYFRTEEANVTNSSPPSFRQAVSVEAGNVVLNVARTTNYGREFYLQQSTDLKTWETISSVLTLPETEGSTNVLITSTNTHAFFKVMSSDITTNITRFVAIGSKVLPPDGQIRCGTNMLAGSDNGLLFSTYDIDGGDEEFCTTEADSSGEWDVFNPVSGEWEILGLTFGGQEVFSSNGGASYEVIGSIFDVSGLTWMGFTYPTNAGFIPAKSWCARIPAWANKVVP